MAAETGGRLMGQKIASGLVALVCVWALKFGFNMVTTEAVDSLEGDAAEWVAEDNEWVAEEILDGTAVPARGWLDQPGHGTFEADPAAMRDLISSFHAAGAENVYVVGVEELGQVVLSDAIAVELPEPGYVRDRLFEIETEFFSEAWGEEYEGTPDVGQRYLVVSFD